MTIVKLKKSPPTFEVEYELDASRDPKMALHHITAIGFEMLTE